MLIRFSLLFLFTWLINCFSVGLSQGSDLELMVDWDARTGACASCDFNKETHQMQAYQTVPLNYRGNQSFTYELVGITYESTIYNTIFTGLVLSDSPALDIQFSKSRGQYFLASNFTPLVNLNGVVKRVKTIKIKVINTDLPTNMDRAHVYAANSVLKNGSWYKMGVNKSGVFKITKSFLESLGINTASLNPNHINIYGNHQSELPLNNDLYHPDDLVKNAIYIEGEGDNVFNENDYILFYATGPMKETDINGVGFNYTLNDYDSLSYYYIGIDGSVPSKRVQNLNTASGVANKTSTSFNEVAFYESDAINLLQSSRLWLGESFEIYQSQDFTLPTPGYIASSPALLKCKAAIYSPTGASNISVLLNGQTIGLVDGLQTSGAYTKAILNILDASISLSSSTTVFNLNFNQNGDPSANAWLDAIQLNYRRSLSNAAGQIRVRDWASVGTGDITTFNISSPASGTWVWEVTDPFNIKKATTTTVGSQLQYKVNTDSLRTFAVFSAAQAYLPIGIGAIENQNLHASEQVDYLIVSHASLLSEANRLADLHRANGLKVQVVDVQKVYNEFSSGIADPVAIRWMAKMFYDRANGNPNEMISSLLLFGDGSYDPLRRMKDNDAANLLPTYQDPGATTNDAYITLTSSYTSDDFFGILDDLESMSKYDLMDVGVGRFPVSTLAEATDVVNKIQHYMQYGSSLYSNTAGVSCDENGYASSLGDWRTRSVLISDDEDKGKFVYDCESLADTMANIYPEMNVVKIYLDAFQQESTSSGQRYPEAENAINQIINTGALVANYVGHGGESGLTAERVLSIPTIQEWTNINKLTLFVSATCEFSRFDDPEFVSAGEIMLIQPYGGAIALLTTTRLVYVTTNSNLVRNLYSNLFKLENNKPLTLGEIIRRSKNLTAGDENIRNFTLLGDPALELGRALPNIRTTKINGVSAGSFTDTLKALSRIEIEGEVTDDAGNLVSNFNGIAYPTVYDKAIVRKTLSQDTESPEIEFEDRVSQLYKGKSTVVNGKFKYSFIVPKDINYAYGKGKLSYYAEADKVQKIGFDSSVVIGGVDPNGIVDNLGPEVGLFMNDENFVNMGITDESPVFIAKVSDENGINTTGNGIGHDISIVIDEETASPIILNNYYEADLDTYQSGEVRYQFLNLEPGEHSAKFTVWDVNNNSSVETIRFEVKLKEEVAISHLLNYPNPFVNRTEFYFEHNQVCNQLDAKIEIFTVSGKLVKSIIQTVNTNAFRSDGIVWDGTDDFGDRIGRGVYIYRLSIETDTGEKADKLEKLVIL
ncbi:hypothetical protein DNU06_11645 [Putridiphycobacter roseus]|uniref:Gingipain domain-containing protein n=1 Tax=Putridiphycobacter roseus TaxID=2219161 RepID=A0A2W1N030_9FLAO|nr:type IX secretion system sortase PorU [Putridiphycobacter roseus]PZE16900.1 hypothetical protein DNU06_11645 [Putridiphycobacter roseus]